MMEGAGVTDLVDPTLFGRCGYEIAALRSQ